MSDTGEVMAGSIVADFPRRWRVPRGCKVRTPAGDFIVTASPHPDRTIRLEGKNLEKIAAALGLSA